MLLLFEPFGAGGIPAPTGSDFGYGGFQPVPTVFFSILLMLLAEAVTHG